MRTAPISSATPERALASTERVTGSSFPLLLIALLQDQVAHFVYHPLPVRTHDASRFGEFHHRRSLDLRARAHPVSDEYRNLLPLTTVEVGLTVSGLGIALGLRLPQLGLLHRDGGREPQIDQLDKLLLHLVSVAT